MRRSLVKLAGIFCSMASLGAAQSNAGTTLPAADLLLDFREEMVRFSQANSAEPAQRQVKWFEADADGLGLMCRVNVMQNPGPIHYFTMDGVLSGELRSNETYAVAFASRVRSTDDENGLGQALVFLGEGVSPWRRVILQTVKPGREWKAYFFTGKAQFTTRNMAFNIQMGGRSQTLDIKDLVVARFTGNPTAAELAPGRIDPEAFIRAMRLKR